ncbi:hypothetical protein MT418_000214 [Batrachochytrium dendrobatidis]
MALYLIAAAIYNWSVYACCVRRIFRSETRGLPSASSKFIIKLGISLLTLILIILVLGNYQASRFITITGSAFQSTSIQLVQSLSKIANTIPSDIDAGFIDLILTVKNVTQYSPVTAQDVTRLATVSNASIQGYFTSLSDSERYRVALNSSLVQGGTDQTSAITGLTSVQAYYDALMLAIQAINSAYIAIPGSNNQYYAIQASQKLNPTDISTNMTILNAYFGSFPSLNELYSQFPENLTVMLSDGQAIANNTTDSLSTVISTSLEALVRLIASAVVSRKFSTISPIDIYTVAISMSLDSFTLKLQTIMPSISTINVYRQLAQLSLTALVLLFFFMWWIEIFLGNAVCIRAQIIAASFVFSLVVFVTIAYFVSTALLAEGCRMTFHESPPVIQKYLDYPIATSTINNLLIVRNVCMSNKTLLSAGVELGAIDANQANITSQMMMTIPSVQAPPQLNVETYLPISTPPAQFFTNVTAFNISTLNTSNLTMLTAMSIPALKNALSTLRSIVSNMQSSYTVSDLQYTGGATNADKNNALIDFRSRCTTIISGIDNLGGSTLDWFSANTTSLVSDVSNLSSTTTQYQNSTTTAISYYTELTAIVRNYSIGLSSNVSILMADTMSTSISNSYLRLSDQLSCFSMAQQAYTLQDQVCGVGLVDLDSIWFIFLLMSIVITVTIPLIMHATKTLMYNQKELAKPKPRSKPLDKLQQKSANRTHPEILKSSRRHGESRNSSVSYVSRDDNAHEFNAGVARVSTTSSFSGTDQDIGEISPGVGIPLNSRYQGYNAPTSRNHERLSLKPLVPSNRR